MPTRHAQCRRKLRTQTQPALYSKKQISSHPRHWGSIYGPLAAATIRMFHYSRLCSALLFVLIASCANPGSPAMRDHQARLLSRDLQGLSATVNAQEADKMAVTAIEQSIRIAEDYKPARIGWLNNSLVNIGLKKRGLCYHWRNDLFPPLFKLQSKTLKLWLATSNRGNYFEHNAIVVTAEDLPFEQGLILDPWRRGGRLWWGHFGKDKYPWVLLDHEQTPVVLRPLLMRPLLTPTQKPVQTKTSN